MSSSNTPFEVLLQQAADLKTFQLKQKKVWYEKQPIWIQNSLFLGQNENIATIRKELDFSKLFSFSEKCKNIGNDLIKKCLFYEAINEYEKGLSVFHWIEEKDGSYSWKTEGIDDSLLVEKRLTDLLVLSNSCIEEFHTLQTSLILNLTHCYLQLKDWNNCITACSYIIINIDQNNVKALYRRSKAYSTPLSSGNIEFQLALEDLSKAVALSPSDITIRNEYSRIRNEIDKQKQIDKSSLGFLNNKELITSNQYNSNDKKSNNDNNNNDKTPQITYGESLKILNNLKSQLSDAIESEDEILSNQLTKKIVDIELLINEYETSIKINKKIDFLNPSEQMISDAKLKGIDLNDIKIRKLLASIEDNRNDLSKNNNLNEEDYIENAITKLHEEEAEEISNHIINDLDHEQLKSLLFSRNFNVNIHNLEINDLKTELLLLLQKDIIEYYNSSDENNDPDNKDLFTFLSTRYDLKGDSPVQNPILHYYNNFRQYIREINIPFNLFVGAMAAILYLLIAYFLFDPSQQLLPFI